MRLKTPESQRRMAEMQHMRDCGFTLQQIGDHYGISRERVRQIVNNIHNTNETAESLVIYISVPEHSYKRNARGSEMAAMNLAKRFKTVMTEMGIKRLTVKARVRAGEYWTKEMADSANIEMRKNIFGSQY